MSVAPAAPVRNCAWRTTQTIRACIPFVVRSTILPALYVGDCQLSGGTDG